MDILKQELLNKRQTLSEQTAGRKVFNRLKIEHKRLRQEDIKPMSKPESGAEKKLNLPKHEVIRQLRILKQPVTLFSESDGDRLDRLNDVVHATCTTLFEIDDGDKTERRTNGHDDDDDVAGIERFKRMKHEDWFEMCDEDKIVVFFNKVLSEWKHELDEMKEAEKKTANGKLTLANFNQCVSCLNPLFNLCRKKVLHNDIRQALTLVVNCCMKRDYSAAMNHYIRIAIGNSAWPIGVTMVGIHERSASEKIHTSSVAHVMNDETTRKYLTSVKRLITFCERHDHIWDGGSFA